MTRRCTPGFIFCKESGREPTDGDRQTFLMRKLTHEEIVARQASQTIPRVPLVVVLDNIRSLNNVGAIFRTADGIGIEKLWLCGITGYPPQSGIAKTALGAENRVAWDYHKDVVEVVTRHRKQGYRIIMLEQTEPVTVYHAFQPTAPVCLVVGNEVDGVDERILSLADGAIDVPMAGIKNSLNVAVAFGVAGYEIRNKLLSWQRRVE